MRTLEVTETKAPGVEKTWAAEERQASKCGWNMEREIGQRDQSRSPRASWVQ